MRPSLCPASTCSISSFTLAVMTSLAVCALALEGRVAMLLVSLVVAMLLMGWFLRFEWPCCVCSQTRLGPGPRQQGRQVQVAGSIPWRAAASGTEGRSEAEVCTSAARKMRVPLARARDGVPQEGLVSLPRSAKTIGLLQLLWEGGRCGRERPAGGGAGRRMFLPAAGRGRLSPTNKRASGWFPNKRCSFLPSRERSFHSSCCRFAFSSPILQPWEPCHDARRERRKLVST